MRRDIRNNSQESLLESLQDSELSEVRLDPVSLSIEFRFTFGPERENVSIQMSKIVHIAISKDPDDEEMLAIVGKVLLNPVLDGGLSILEDLKYPFKSTEDQTMVLTYPSVQLYHFHLEGDICADVVCAQYKMEIANP